MMPIIRRLMPEARKLGTSYAPAETNSAYSYELLGEGRRESRL